MAVKRLDADHRRSLPAARRTRAALAIAATLAIACMPSAPARAAESAQPLVAHPGMLAIAESPAAALSYGTQLLSGCAWATWVEQCQNLAIYSNGGSFTNEGCGPPNGCTFGPEFQCTELAQRYAYYAWGEPPTWDRYYSGAAADMWNAGPRLPIPLQQFPNGQGVPPERGDLMIFGPGWIGSYWDPDGHVAVVSDATSTTVEIAQENGTPSGLDSFSLSGTRVAQPNGYTPLIGWLHNPNAGRAPAVVALAGGPQIVMWQGLGGHLWAATESAGWSAPVDLTAAWHGNGLAASAPSLAATGPDSLVAYWTGTNRDLWRAIWSAGTWSTPADVSSNWSGGLAAPVSAPSVAVLPSGEQLVFWQDASGHLWEAWSIGSAWYGPADWTAAWGGAATLTSAPTASVTPSGDTQLVFWSGPGGHLFEAWYAGGAWHGPADWSAALRLPELIAAPSLAVSGDGTQLVFFEAAGGDLNEIWFTDAWHGPVDWSMRWGTGGMSSAPEVALTPDGTQQLVFWVSGDGAITEAWWAAARWNGPVEWVNLRQPVSTPSVTTPATGVPDVFWTGPAAHLMEVTEQQSAWTTVQDLTSSLSGTPILASDPSTTTDQRSGTRYLAWQGSGGHLWVASATEASWSAPRDLTALWGGAAPLTSAPSLALDGTELVVFWTGTSGHVWEAWLSGSTWYGPADWTTMLALPPAASGPAAAVTADRSTQLVFYQDTSGHLEQIWYAGGGWHGPVDWTGRYSWPALTSAPAVAVTPDGSQQVVYWQSSGELWEAWWAGAWYGPEDWTAQWNSGSLLISAPAVVVTPDGSTQMVFWQGVDGDLWEAWWTTRWNGPVDWSTLGPLN